MKIIYAVTNPGLLEIPELLPEPASNFIPEWYKNVPVKKNIAYSDGYVPQLKSNYKSVKQCPSFVEVFKEGYVLKAVTDMWFYYDELKNIYRYELPHEDSFQKIEIHSNDQYVDYLPASSNIKFVFKYASPFLVFTEPGYSIRQMPIPYDFNKDWHSSYGVFKTDKLHEANVQINFTSNKKEILIKQGTPLCVHIPYKRIKTSVKIVDLNKNYKLNAKWKKGRLLSSLGNFKGGYLKNL